MKNKVFTSSFNRIFVFAAQLNYHWTKLQWDNNYSSRITFLEQHNDGKTQVTIP